MPSISITKEFIIKDDKTLQKLNNILQEPSKAPVIKTYHLQRVTELLNSFKFN